MKSKIPRHNPAFKGQIKTIFRLKPKDQVLDLTLGDGGHSQEALEAGAKVVSFDIDPVSIKRATRFIPKKYHPNWVVKNSNMTQVGKIVNKRFNAILIDLGPSQYQVLAPSRGFSFSSSRDLDMRLDKNLAVKAKDLIAALGSKELEHLFSLSDEPRAKQIAKAIVAARKKTSLITAAQLAGLVAKIKGYQAKTHPATQVFLALRMAVNLEREVIQETLPQLPDLLKPNGFLGIISFHSGEDRLVKQFGKQAVENNILRVIYKKPLTPTAKEINNNPRVRSAKLRLYQKK